MKNRLSLLLLCCCVAASPLFAQSVSTPTSKDSPVVEIETRGAFPFEFDAEYGYMGHGEVERENNRAELDEDYFWARFLYTPRTAIGILRLGAAYERYGFGYTGSDFELPGGLQSATAVIGLDTKFSDSILVRIEATPGLYSGKELDGGDFHMPVVIGGSYIYNDNLQFVLGVSIDYERDNPVLPGGGIRWRMGSQWVLNAVLPKPRIEFELMQGFTLYAGADVRGSTFRVHDTFGDERGDTALNNAVLTYTEVRVGTGFEWKPAPQIRVGFEGGYLAYREFDYHRTEVRYHHEEGAPYAAASFRMAF